MNSSRNGALGPIREVIEEIQRWLEKEWNITIRHLQRTEHGCGLSSVSWDLSTNELGNLAFQFSVMNREDVYLNDLAHVTCVRRVRENN